MRFSVTFLLVTTLCIAADKSTVPQLIEQARVHAPQFRDALVATLGEAAIKKGTAVRGDGADFIWAVSSATPPTLSIDGSPTAMTRLGGDLWYHIAQLKTGTGHEFYYVIGGARFGNRADVAAFGPESYEKPGVPRGKLTEKMVHTSKIYDGMQSDYWVYAPAQYDPATPAAVMVWQDGHNLADRERTRAQIVFDNLTAAKKLPVIVHIFIDPGKIGAKAMRSIEYDTMDDRYARFLRDEILPEVAQKYNLRKDGYSRAISGSSSGGICSFKVAWQQPGEFSRVLSWVGSFTSIQWHPGELDGGNVFPFMIRKQPKRNIRVWLQDGSEDLENTHGSWPLQNIQMANSLKMTGYDFHLSFGNGNHNGAQGSAQLPESLAWLWRDYDPARTGQTYEMEPAEKDKPLFRVSIANRDH
jgi:enterochelin esterase-like enzyme